METEEEILKKAETIIAKRRLKECEDEIKKDEEKFRGYVFWCSEGCGLVSRQHRCEQWSRLIAIPSGAVKAIRENGANCI